MSTSQKSASADRRQFVPRTWSCVHTIRQPRCTNRRYASSFISSSASFKSWTTLRARPTLAPVLYKLVMTSVNKCAVYWTTCPSRTQTKVREGGGCYEIGASICSENVIAVTMTFIWKIHTSFAIMRLFFRKVSVIFNTLLPVSSKTLYTNVKFPASTSEHITCGTRKL
jgi:hypothetical protein